MCASRFLSIAILFLACFSATFPALARSLVLAGFDVELQVLTSGDLLVTETLRPRFEGAWNGLERQIPVDYRTPQGFNYRLILDEVSATDERGNPLKLESSRQRSYRNLRVWVPGATDATKTVVLKYRVRNGLRFFADHDELYWNVTGDEWDIPIDRASARIILPAPVTGVKALAFTGAYGGRDQEAEVEIGGPIVMISAPRPLDFREGLTAVVGWDKGFVKEPNALDNTRLFFWSNWPLGLPLLVLAILYSLWRRHGRDPTLRPIAVAYGPPDGMTPAEVGTLVDHATDMRDITATLVDLAVRGFLRIEEQHEAQLFGLWTNRGYVFHRVRPASEETGLKPHEARLMSAVFTDSATPSMRLDDLENRFYRSLPGIHDAVFQALQDRRCYRSRPDKVKQVYWTAGLFVMLAGAAGGAVLAQHLGMQELPFILASLLSGLIVLGFSWIMPARTIHGTRTFEKVLGFEEFLTRVEADRFARVIKTPELFEKLLPYAMALGVEQTWVRAFETMVTQPPAWYTGGDAAGFHPRGFVNRLDQMAARAGAAMQSAPRSSGGSGFSGGGSSGGGFGGGGGRGF
ncbi:MAG: DUF2207 domain-containing protein [Nitrospiraceae bacterium]